jgi:hypothetical protein
MNVIYEKHDLFVFKNDLSNIDIIKELFGDFSKQLLFIFNKKKNDFLNSYITDYIILI